MFAELRNKAVRILIAENEARRDKKSPFREGTERTLQGII